MVPTSAASTLLTTDLAKLATDTKAIQAKSQVTPALQAVVTADLTAIGKEATKSPAAATVTTLANDVKALNGGVANFTTGTLQTDFQAVMASEGVTDTTLITKTEADMTAVSTATNVTSTDVATLQADQTAVANDRAVVSPKGSLAGVAQSLAGIGQRPPLHRHQQPGRPGQQHHPGPARDIRQSFRQLCPRQQPRRISDLGMERRRRLRTHRRQREYVQRKLFRPGP